MSRSVGRPGTVAPFSLLCASVVAGVLWLAFSSGAAAQAGSRCQCRAGDVVAFEGQTVCLELPDGPRLARCEKVLNNTSWTFLPERCTKAT